MSKKHTSKDKTDWDQVDALTDEQVRAGIEADPDAHPTDEDFWKAAGCTRVVPQAGQGLRAYLCAHDDGDSPRQ